MALAYQSIFKRYELKYLLTRQQYERVQQVMVAHMAPDDYGRTTIRNLYFDTPDYRLIRRSLEKPVYKEKLRLRSYARTQPDTPVFVELKKKFQGVVYKRRLSLPEQQASAWLAGAACPVDTQIAREISYFREYYGNLSPTVFLCYDRVAWYCRDGGDFRVTFDERILCRREDLTLSGDAEGIPILDERYVLMEVKTSGGIPLWMTAFLTREGICKASFSKYGTAYRELIYGGMANVGNTFQRNF